MFPRARSQSVVLDSLPATVRLAPRECGEIRFASVQPTNATVSVRSGDFSLDPQPVPASRRIVVPVGRYTVRVEAQGCFPFEGAFDVQRARPATVFAKLVCG